jgi:hypothetical protein
MEILEFKADDLSGPKTESGEKKQDRLVATAAWGRAIRGKENPFHLLGGEGSGY